MKNDLGLMVKEIRQKARLSSKNLAKYFGIKKETLLEYENGVSSIPTLILQEYVKIKEDKGKKVREYLKNNNMI